MADDTDDDFLSAIRTKFERAAEVENDNRVRGLEDLRFARQGKQWPAEIEKQRELEGRPCLTINKMPTFIRQVVNDARQNKPAITVHPADSGADPETAEILSGLIRNIEQSSDADVAYDTAIEGAASNGFGYFRINTAYTSDDAFDQDIVIERIANPFSVFGDPDSQAADSSDWNCAFVVETMTKDAFEEKYKGAEAVDFEADGYIGLQSPWRDGDQIMVAEYWERKLVEKAIVALSNGTVVDLEKFEENPGDFLGLTIVGEPRTVKSHKVRQHIVTGAEVLETIEWPGKYIPIVPVYGDEVNVEGKRDLYSLIHFAKGSQQEFNFNRTAATEQIALAPKAPFIGEEGTFDADPQGWSTANSVSHPYLEYTAGKPPPARQPYDATPAAAITQAMQASDDMKATIGIYDASLGARSNETSGRAITARQREGDVSTFHFIDNLTRAIRHAGRILIDLIPKVYSTPRVLRILGQDMAPQTVQVSPDAQQAMAAAQQQAQMQAQGMARMAALDQQQAVFEAELQKRIGEIARIYDLTTGKYDLTVKAGPSYTTQREESRAELVDIIRSYPAAAEILGPMYLRNSDWPGADEAADKLEAASAGAQGSPDAAAQQQMAAMQQAFQQLQAENAQLKDDRRMKMADLQLKARDARTKEYEAYTDRIRALADANNPAAPQYSYGTA